MPDNIQNKLKIYNTKTRSLEVFIPIDPNNIRIYSCGPTVYHYQHLGNMRSFVFADTLHRALSTLYPTVTHVINITDVGHLVGDGNDGEDKLEKGSRREGKSVWDIAKMYTDTFMEDLENLNIDTENYIFPRATDFIPQQIALIERLERRGYTYKTRDGIYFDTNKYEAYGDFAKLDTDNLNAGERVDMGDKKNKTDFALWKFSPTDAQRQMEWESPWGIGFPGWHIECSAMSEAVLGKHFDIHTGGIDHIPVHHTNEIAQSVCAHDNEAGYEGYVNYWMHNNFLNDKSGKMSKSNDDFLRLQTLIDDGYNPSVYRYLLLTTNYKSEINFSYESLDAAKSAYNKLTRYLHNAAKVKENIIDATKCRINTAAYDEFMSHIYDDLNTSAALATMWTMINDKKDHAYATVLMMNKILGLDLTYEEKSLELTPEQETRVADLQEQRKIARLNKDWATSDMLRDELREIGIDVVD